MRDAYAAPDRLIDTLEKGENSHPLLPPRRTQQRERAARRLAERAKAERQGKADLRR